MDDMSRDRNIVRVFTKRNMERGEEKLVLGRMGNLLLEVLEGYPSLAVGNRTIS